VIAATGIEIPKMENAFKTASIMCAAPYRSMGCRFNKWQLQGCEEHFQAKARLERRAVRKYG